MRDFEILSIVYDTLYEYPVDTMKEAVDMQKEACGIDVDCFWNHVYERYCDNYMVMHYNTKSLYDGCWDDFNGALRTCRGLVIDPYKQEMVLHPYDKFFNYGEKPETQPNVIKEKIANASVVQVSDKMDGSLISMRWYSGEIVIANATTMSHGFLNDERDSLYNNITDRASMLQIVVKYMKKSGYDFNSMLQRYSNFTLMFEFIAPTNTMVVDYISQHKEGLFLHGMRNMETNLCLPYSEVVEVAEANNLKHVDYYAGMSLDDVMLQKKNYKHNEKEGYVMFIDGTFLKIKCDDYINYVAFANDCMSPNSVVKMYVEGTLDSVFDDLDWMRRAFITTIRKELDNYARLVYYAAYELCKRIMMVSKGDKKSFFVELKKYKKGITTKKCSELFLNGTDGFTAIESHQGKIDTYKHILDNKDRLLKELTELGIDIPYDFLTTVSEK